MYITWQQVTEDTLPLHFKIGFASCKQFLKGAECPSVEERLGLKQNRELRISFQHGLGLKEEDEEDGHNYVKDVLKCGD